MTLLVDAAPLVALADAKDPRQAEIEQVLTSEPGALVIPAPVTAEVDYLLRARLGERSRLAFLDDVAAGRFQIECLEADEHATIADLERAYTSLEPGLADLSIVVLAGRFRTRRILTFDERDFRTIRPLQGGTFKLLPADAPDPGLTSGRRR
jgi:predicted nucleic acid-binding protein